MVFEFNRPYGPFGFVLKEIGEGTATWEYAVNKAHFNPNGVLHGGVLMSLLDSAMGHAVSLLVVPQGRINAAAQFNINFLEPIRAGTISARGAVVKLGRRTAVAEGRAFNEHGLVVALATSTHSLLP